MLERPVPSPPTSPSLTAASRAPPDLFVRAVETSALMSAASEHLNRQSLVLLLRQVIAEADERYRSLEGRLEHEVSQRAALQAEVEALRRTMTPEDRLVP